MFNISYSINISLLTIPIGLLHKFIENMEKSFHAKTSKYRKYTHKGRQILDRTVYIITNSPNSTHIVELVKHLEKKNILIKIQNDRHSLIEPSVHDITQKKQVHRFIIVDNKEGVVKLGRYFAVTEIFVVGFPKIGPNPKNHYCTRVQDVQKKYIRFLKEEQMQFKNSSKDEMKKMNFPKPSKSKQNNSMKKIADRFLTKSIKSDRRQYQHSQKPQLPTQEVIYIFSQLKNNSFQELRQKLLHISTIFRSLSQQQLQKVNGIVKRIIITQWKSLHLINAQNFKKIFCLCENSLFGNMLCQSPSNLNDQVTYFQSLSKIYQQLPKFEQFKNLREIQDQNQKIKSQKCEQKNSRAQKIRTDRSSYNGLDQAQSSLTFENTQMPIKSMWYSQDSLQNNNLIMYHRHHVTHARTERVEPSVQLDPTKYYDLKSQKNAKIEHNLQKKQMTNQFQNKIPIKKSLKRLKSSQSFHKSRMKRVLSEVKNNFNIKISNIDSQKVQVNQINKNQKKQAPKKERIFRRQTLEPKIQVYTLARSLSYQNQPIKRSKAIINPIIEKIIEENKQLKPFAQQQHTSQLYFQDNSLNKFKILCNFEDTSSKQFHLWYKGQNKKLVYLANHLAMSQSIKIEEFHQLCPPFQEYIQQFIQSQLIQINHKTQSENHFSFKAINNQYEKIVLLIDEQNVEKWINGIAEGVQRAFKLMNHNILLKILIVNKTNSQLFFKRKLDSLKQSLRVSRWNINIEIIGFFLQECIQISRKQNNLRNKDYYGQNIHNIR